MKYLTCTKPQFRDRARAGMLVFFFLTLSSPALFQSAHGTPSDEIGSRKGVKVPCGRDLYITIPATWTPAPVSFSAVQCAYKNNSSGFPNVNVVVEPAPRPPNENSNDRRIQGVLESYKSVGLYDVSVLGAIPLPTPLPDSSPPSISFGIALQYTGNQGIMTSSVAFLDVEDRRYTITYLDKKSDGPVDSKEATAVVQSLILSEEGVSGLSILIPERNNTRKEDLTRAAFSPSGSIALLLGGALIVGAIIALMRMRQQ